VDKKTILIGLDGVLNTFESDFVTEWYIPPVKRGAKDFLEQFPPDKYELKLFTARPKDLVEKWLKKNKLEKYFSEVTDKLPPKTELIIDAHCLKFNGNYEDLSWHIINFKPWYKIRTHWH